MWQKLGDPIDGMAGNAAKDIFEPSEQINAGTLAGNDMQAIEALPHIARVQAQIHAQMPSEEQRYTFGGSGCGKSRL